MTRKLWVFRAAHLDDRIRYGDEGDDWMMGIAAHQGYPCGDCGVYKGSLHLDSCDIERCKKCRTQYLTCGCED